MTVNFDGLILDLRGKFVIVRQKGHSETHFALDTYEELPDLEESMNTVIRYPWWREELKHHLQELARELRIREWMATSFAETELGNIGFVVDFLYDTIRIQEDPQRLLGMVFLNQSEIEAVAKFSSIFLSVVDRNFTDADVFRDPSWSQVVVAAREALAALAEAECA